MFCWTVSIKISEPESKREPINLWSFESVQELIWLDGACGKGPIAELRTWPDPVGSKECAEMLIRNKPGPSGSCSSTRV